MSLASLASFKRNAVALPKVLPMISNQIAEGIATERKVKARADQFAPEDYKMMFEKFTPTSMQRNTCEKKNLFIDTTWADQGNTRQELVNRWYFLTDRWNAFHCQFLPLCTGGYGFLAAQAYVLSNDSWTPSAFRMVDAESKKAWYEGRDLLRYKYTPAFLNENKFKLEMTFPVPSEKWNDIHEKNDVRRNPEWARDVAKFYAKYYPLHIQKRQLVKGLMRTMGACPSFPLLKKVGATTRVRDLFECIFTEDVMVMKGKLLDTMSDDELACYAWRRFLAPQDKELTRAQLLERCNDYHTMLGEDVLKGEHPGIIGSYMYMIGYYNDPAFLTEDFSELEKDDFSNLGNWSRDLFMQRLEFENGPLRDQVEAHVVKQKAEQEARLAEIKARHEIQA